MARGKDSIQRLLDKGKTPEEIVKSGKYTQAEVDAYLNSAEVDTTPGEESNSDSDQGSNDLSQEQLQDALNEDVGNVEEMGQTTLNPAGGATISSQERGYTQVKSATPISEVPKNHTPVNQSESVASNSDPNANPFTETSGEPKMTTPNPALVNASDEKKRTAAERLYDRIVIPVYEKLCMILPAISKFNENKIRRMAAKDEIDLEMILQWFDGSGNLNETTLRQVISEHNQESDKAFEYDQKFVDDAREPTIREFVNRGWGIAEQDELKWILIEKGIDILQNAVMLNMKKYALLSEAKLYVLERKKEQRTNNPNQQQQQPPPNYTPPPPPNYTAQQQTPPPQFTQTNGTTMPQFTQPNNTIQDAEIIEETVKEDGEKH